MKPTLRRLSVALVLCATSVVPRWSLGQSPIGSPAPSVDPAAQPAPTEDPRTYAPPKAQAALLTPEPIWINQKAEIEVALRRDAADPNKPPGAFGEVRVRNAIALRTDYAPPPSVVTEAGVRYLVQLRRYLVFPQVPGVIEVPGIEVSWDGAEGSRIRTESEPLRFEAALPSGAEGSDFLVAQSVRITDSIDGDLKRLKVGDSFTRTLTITARDTDAMMMPIVPAYAPSGLAAYPSAPEVRTKIDRGRYVAKRVESVTYVAERWGEYTLPAIEVRWFEPSTGTWHVEASKKRSFRAHINPRLGLSAFGPIEDATKRLAGFVLLCLLVWAVSRLWRRRRGLNAAAAPEDSKPPGPGEERLFWRVQRFANQGDALGALNATYAWIDARNHDDEGPTLDPPTLDALAERSPSLHEPAVELQRRLFATPNDAKSWDGRAFATAIRKARKDHAEDQREYPLPQLNPGHPGTEYE